MVDHAIYVAYKQCKVLMKDGHPEHVHGRGTCIDDACMDYIRRINGKTLIFRDCTEERKERTLLFLDAEFGLVQGGLQTYPNAGYCGGRYASERVQTVSGIPGEGMDAGTVSDGIP
jgi:hypothetical protein